jgi:hypothetical protein
VEKIVSGPVGKKSPLIKGHEIAWAFKLNTTGGYKRPFLDEND